MPPAGRPRGDHDPGSPSSSVVGRSRSWRRRPPARLGQARRRGAAGMRGGLAVAVGAAPAVPPDRRGWRSDAGRTRSGSRLRAVDHEAPGVYPSCWISKMRRLPGITSTSTAEYPLACPSRPHAPVGGLIRSARARALAPLPPGPAGALAAVSGSTGALAAGEAARRGLGCGHCHALPRRARPPRQVGAAAGDGRGGRDPG
jgi:hypothetical protein